MYFQKSVYSFTHVLKIYNPYISLLYSLVHLNVLSSYSYKINVLTYENYNYVQMLLITLHTTYTLSFTKQTKYYTVICVTGDTLVI